VIPGRRSKLGNTCRYGLKILRNILNGAEQTVRDVHDPTRLAAQLRREEVKANHYSRLDQDCHGGQRNENCQKSLIGHFALPRGQFLAFDRFIEFPLSRFNRFTEPFSCDASDVPATLHDIAKRVIGRVSDAGFLDFVGKFAANLMSGSRREQHANDRSNAASRGKV
jgi:hypothetical protein